MTLTREYKVALYAIDRLLELDREGKVRMADRTISGEAAAHLERLHAEGFEPSEEELADCVEGFLAAGLLTILRPVEEWDND